jgi:hypothetical protein
VEILIALLIAALVCVGIAIVAWVIVAVLSMIPIPAPFGRIVVVVVWAIAGLAMLVVLIRAIQGQPLGLLLGVV